MDPFEAAMNLLRRLPPEDIESSFKSISVLREDLSETLLQHIDFPLRVGHDPEVDKPFILSDFNTFEESYRYPPIFLDFV